MTERAIRVVVSLKMLKVSFLYVPLIRGPNQRSATGQANFENNFKWPVTDPCPRYWFSQYPGFFINVLFMGVFSHQLIMNIMKAKLGLFCEIKNANA